MVLAKKVLKAKIASTIFAGFMADPESDLEYCYRESLKLAGRFINDCGLSDDKDWEDGQKTKDSN